MSQPKPLQKSLPGLWRITRYFWPHLRQFRGLIAGSMLALVAEVGLLKKEGYEVRFKDFMKIGIPFTIVAVAASYIFIWFVWGK